MPDSVFVEDIAVVFDELAIVTRPGAASRRAEDAGGRRGARPSSSGARRFKRPARWTAATCWWPAGACSSGSSSRTNARRGRADASDARAARLHVCEVAVHRLPAPEVGGHRARRRPAAGEPGMDHREHVRRVRVRRGRSDEPMAANALRVGDRVIYPSAFPRTARTHCTARSARASRSTRASWRRPKAR